MMNEMALLSRATLILLLALTLTRPAEGLIGSDGLCELLVFLPFTTLGLYEGGNLDDDARTSYAFSHMGAALLAADHFNTRNPTVVPELAKLTDCNAQLILGNTSFIDTGTLTKMASQRLVERGGPPPCGIAGPFNDQPATELAVMAQAWQFPMVVHRAYNVRLVSDWFSGFTAQVFPDMLESSRTLVSWLRYNGRTNFIAILSAFSDVNFQRREALAFHLDKNEMEFFASSYRSGFTRGELSAGVRTPLEALRKIKERGYRTIVVAMDTSFIELGEIADAAEELGMNNGDHMWVWYDTFEPVGTDDFVGDEKALEKLVAGSAWMVPYPLASERFDEAWSGQGQENIDRLNSFNPIRPNKPGYRNASENFFQDVLYAYGSSFMYDAVMTLGIGACLAEQQNGTVSGIDHLYGVRNASFTGASGYVSFGRSEDLDRLGARQERTVMWVVANFLPPPAGAWELQVPDFLFPYEDAEWVTIAPTPFLFADGSADGPPLTDDTEQNYLTVPLRAVGLTLMSIAMAAAAISVVFVFLRRKHRVLAASQPPFLYMICFGSFVQASSILTISFDEGAGWTTEQLSRACMATPWVLSLGHIVVYAALFTKMWRVEELMQFRRRQIKLRHVVWPMIALLVSALIILSLWTALEPLMWQRVEVNSISHESIGECTGDYFAAFLAPLLVLMIIPMIVTGYYAWKTKDVDEALTESSWIYLLIMVQMEVILIATPIVIVLQEASPVGRYIGLTLMFWFFPMSALGLIILPKYIAYRRAVLGRDSEAKRKRGQAIGTTRVTGVSSSGEGGHTLLTHGVTTTATNGHHAPTENGADEDEGTQQGPSE